MSYDLSQCRKGDGTLLSRKELVGEMLIFMTAGSDPSAYTITMVLNNICRHVSVRDKILTELKEAGALESSTAGVVTYTQTTRLEYLHAVVKETLRHSPAFQVALPRISPSPHGLEVLPGVRIPPGVSMSANSYINHRDKAVFGNDADEFIPERWLPIGGERYRLMARHMAVFGYGSAQCLGLSIAMLKINKCVVEVRNPGPSTYIHVCQPLLNSLHPPDRSSAASTSTSQSHPCRYKSATSIKCTYRTYLRRSRSVRKSWVFKKQIFFFFSFPHYLKSFVVFPHSWGVLEGLRRR